MQKGRGSRGGGKRKEMKTRIKMCYVNVLMKIRKNLKCLVAKSILFTLCTIRFHVSLHFNANHFVNNV